MAVEVATPLSLKIFAEIQRAAGATPMAVPPSDPPTAMPMVWVP